MNKHYVNELEDLPEAQPSDEHRPWIVRWFWPLYVGGVLAIGLLGLVTLAKHANAQTISAPTRSSAYDWATGP